MEDLVRVLIVEDSEDDALLISKQLDRGGLKHYSRRVDNRDAFEKAIRDECWDVIISDYSLPMLTGLDALYALKTADLDIPFIIVSGAIDEEVAVKMMKAGAHDYLMKDNLTRLLPAVQREIAEAKVRKERMIMEDELRKSEQRFKNLFKKLSDGVLVINVKTEAVVQTNTAFCEMTGYSEEKLLGMSLEDIHPADSLEYLRNEIQKRSLSDTALVSDVPVLKKDGTIFFADVSATLVEIGNDICVLGVFRDMSEQRLSEEKLKEKMNEIQKQYEIMLGRERRVVEMKDEVNELLEELGRPNKYFS